MDNLDLFLLLYLIGKHGSTNLVTSNFFDREFDEIVNDFERLEPDVLKTKFTNFVKSQKEKFRELNEIHKLKDMREVEDMTKAEKIEEIRNCEDLSVETTYAAIEALRRDTCEDAVNRKEIQQKINRLWNSDGDKDYCMETLRDFVTELPPVTPAREKGEWIKMPLVEAGQTYSHECSLCGRRILVADIGLSEFPYCHCGAAMDVENKKNCNNCIYNTDADEIHGITPCGSCGIDLKNFKQEMENEDA